MSLGVLEIAISKITMLVLAYESWHPGDSYLEGHDVNFSI
jgi:hypothetical protein